MRVQISGQQLKFPAECACCGGEPTARLATEASRTTGKRVVRTQSRAWEFPYCQRCLQHVAAWPANAGCWTAFLGVITCFGWFIVHYFLRKAATERARALCSQTCACCPPAVAYVGWTGTVHTFEIASRAFALKFMLANRNRILNVDYDVLRELEQLDQQARVPRYPMIAGPASQPPVVAPGSLADAEQSVYLEALERLEKQKGAASRRAHLEVSLKRLQTPSLREKLALEASRIEVQAVLEKVDGLKTVVAKKRHLTAAIAEIRADNIPDELQAQELAWLDEALRQLESD